ncbi:MAG: hypothetical protein KGL17_04330, partial [Betaproteobacteria bacterium]|nr:hypothetical protein [Betaproteobacteria bacterium]
FTDTSANFSDKNVGTNKTVTVLGISATGTDAGNYSLNNTSATTTASIVAVPLTPIAIITGGSSATSINSDAYISALPSFQTTAGLTGLSNTTAPLPAPPATTTAGTAATGTAQVAGATPAAGTPTVAGTTPSSSPASSGTSGTAFTPLVVVLTGPSGKPLLSVFNGGQKLPEND